MEDPESAAIRTGVFEWLQYQAEISEDVFDRKDLIHGFTFRGEAVPLVGPQGIFKPKAIRYYPISITTSPESPYMDELGRNQLIHYQYQRRGPDFHENVRLKRAMQEKIPLAYFIGLVPNKYLALFPVFIVAADDASLTFTVEIGDYTVGGGHDQVRGDLDSKRIHDPVFDEVRKEYVTRETLVRVHQREFREKVLHAYNEHCSFCSLKHRELLDAAHIIPDSRGGTASVNNGISLCKIHHSAFDKNILGLNEDYRIEVRKDILEEIDGPMLRYGLQEMHHRQILLPGTKRYYPDKGFIKERYGQFTRRG